MDMMVKPQLMRDAVIETIIEAAAKDRDILFISADLGAAALDGFRRDFPDQFIHAGIAEQNMVDLASGLALSGKKVFLYAMAPFITARCYEQVKCVIASMNLPVTLIAVGVGLGYDHATLTHFTPEDIACMRALNGIEVLTPSDAPSAAAIARACIDDPKFRYIRLERQPLASLYHGGFDTALEDGFGHLTAGSRVAIVACGYLTHKALAAADELRDAGIEAGVVDLVRAKPLDGNKLTDLFAGYDAVLTVEEQLLEGGMGSAVAEALIDAADGRGGLPPIKRLGLRDGFEVVNGSRDELHRLYGIGTPDIAAAARDLAEAQSAEAQSAKAQPA
ncbi:MAG: transketolase C-terminal domain-containing protein [Rhodospirillales bacterium]|jgi:transketolase|nr:1-deoxy-D-xylulose-5-phosphate synthase [Rhodospirillaceae bacterium]MDP6427077.1 transketolase C-terminal domain-containing protein [Rhodospirillales bacterium]MDP6645253.1 transketolase C-terminal domain-containing protein [Rhodospirillales bacterium]MDP6841871.1 transketolase C-terminal domain-containing protein [Rhodospirillales bacterium]